MLPQINDPVPQATRDVVRSGQAFTNPVLLYPDYSTPEFDRFLFGWINDYHGELDPKSLTCVVDKKHDLSSNISVESQKMTDTGFVYDWKCDVPSELQDYKTHLVEMTILGHDGILREFFATPVFEPVEPPGIEFLIYPYRNILEPVEKQDAPDPYRIFVAMSGQFREEWKDSYDKLLEAWTVDCIKEPLKAEFNLKSRVAIISLPCPIYEDTVLRFGPVILEDGIIAEDEEPIFAGDGGKDSGCNCGYSLNSHFDRHDAHETEKHAWAYRIDRPPDPACPLFLSSGCHTIIPGTPETASQTSITQTEDLGHFGDPDDQAWFPNITNGIHTVRPGAKDIHYYYAELDAKNDGETCWSGILSADYTYADDINPSFIEVRVVTGPVAAEWLEQKKNSPGAYPNQLVQSQIYAIQDDVCGLYVIVDAVDSNPGGISSIVIDWMDAYGVVHYGDGSALGPQIWIDKDVQQIYEWIFWADNNYQDEGPGSSLEKGKIAKDYLNIFEELAMVRDLDGYLMQGALDVRFRATDKCGNWKRTMNVVDPQFLLNPMNKLYHVADAGIIAVDYFGNTTVDTEFCSVPVQERTQSGSYVID
ncbi:MAG TPA: hypothetical protein ENN67_05275, partial [Firmicutes bacterium]|nr:hypothetical protein [Bacillota bacterium]